MYSTCRRRSEASMASRICPGRLSVPTSAALYAKPKFRSDDGLFPPPLERPPHQLFIDEGTVDLGGVKEIESQFKRTVNGGHSDRLSAYP